MAKKVLAIALVAIVAVSAAACFVACEEEPTPYADLVAVRVNNFMAEWENIDYNFTYEGSSALKVSVPYTNYLEVNDLIVSPVAEYKVYEDEGKTKQLTDLSKIYVDGTKTLYIDVTNGELSNSYSVDVTVEQTNLPPESELADKQYDNRGGHIYIPEGAETDDYYSLLEPPYEAKNGPFDTVRELLLVKGFSEPILTGGVFDPVTVQGDTSAKKSNVKFSRFSETNDIVIAGIESMLTTYGDGKVNIQSAPYDVLRTLPGVDDILARAIMEERDMVDENGDPDPFTSAQDLFSRVDGLESAIADRITVISRFCRFTATGRSGNVEHQVWCIAYADGTDLRFLRWVEEP